jgi:hypothetical protein
MVQCLIPKISDGSESLLTTERQRAAPRPFKLVNFSGIIFCLQLVLLLSPRTIDRKGKLYKSVVSLQGLLHRFHNRCFFVESFSEKQ